MKRLLISTFTSLLVLADSSRLIASPERQTMSHTFIANGDHFELDGKAFQIRSGEMHYPRVPKPYWRTRMKMLRAMGLNALTTYVFWNLHEPTPGNFDFSGQLDLAEYIKMAAEEGLFVILRPGPYICAEWEFGGLPAWLLKDRDSAVRQNDPRFIEAASRYLQMVGHQVQNLMLSRGGPIILTQIENEYGSFGKDRTYLDNIRAAFIRAGFDGQFFTSDSVIGQPNAVAEMIAGSFPDLPLAINFGQDHVAQNMFAILDRVRPRGVRMNSEYWFGWFDHLGSKHSSKNPEAGLRNLEWMLSEGININFYMAHGGTNFGFMNGANLDLGFYKPITTSYDYDAPINEVGQPTAKFYAIRHLMQKYHPNEVFPPVPDVPNIIKAPSIQFTEYAPLTQLLGQPSTNNDPKTMEEMDQSYGFVLYRHQVTDDFQGMIELRELRDYAWIHQGDNFFGTLDRRLKQSVLRVDLNAGEPLEILVENMGRLNFSPELVNERKGITKNVLTEGGVMTQWETYSLPLTDLSKLQFSKRSGVENPNLPNFYRGFFDLSELGDTFFDTNHWGRGVVFVNGHNLGRYWNIGPQMALYCPHHWLKKENNEIVVFGTLPAGD